jgi:hypothetical protein
MMETVNTSEISVSFYQTTWCNILENSFQQIIKKSLRNIIWVYVFQNIHLHVYRVEFVYFQERDIQTLP